MQVSGSRGYSKRRNMIGIAKTYELTAITGPFIAYVAVVVGILSFKFSLG